MFGTRHHSHTTGRSNLAGRMGRWSAAHWKTATFGWLALVVVAFGLGGMVGMKTIDANTPGPGESGRDGQDPRRRVQAARRRERPDPELDPTGGRSRVHGGRARRRRGDLEARNRPARPLAARSGERRADRPERPRRARGAPDPRRPRHGGRPDRPGPRPGGRAAEGTPAALHRRVRRREQGRCPGHRVRERPREGRAALAPGHADHPPGGVRRARGGGNPAAPRPDRRLRDVRPDLAAEPCVPGRDAGAGARAPDRARRRRRLLDVLLEARTRGAGRRTQRAGGARGRSGDVGPLGAHRRPHRDRGDGGDVPDRRPDLRVARRCRHHRRRDRGARLLDRAAGAAVEARRQGRSRAPAARRSPSNGRREPDLGRDRRPCPATAARVGPPGRRVAPGAGSPGAPAPHGDGGPRHVPAVASGRAGVPEDAAGVPRDGAARQRRREGAGREGACGSGRDSPARAAGTRERPDARADHGGRQPRRDRRERLDPDRRQDDRP